MALGVADIETYARTVLFCFQSHTRFLLQRGCYEVRNANILRIIVYKKNVCNNKNAVN